jgi:hypothetical protein
VLADQDTIHGMLSQASVFQSLCGTVLPKCVSGMCWKMLPAFIMKDVIQLRPRQVCEVQTSLESAKATDLRRTCRIVDTRSKLCNVIIQSAFVDA